MEARTILNQEFLINYCSEELKTLFSCTFSKIENIEVCLYSLTQNISNLSVKEMIKTKLFLLKWINILANVFFKAWIHMIKHKGSVAISR